MIERKRMTKGELEERLIAFAVDIIKLAATLPKTFVGKHLSEQIIRSGTSPALNYGEAQSAESRKDFIHKIKIILKELRETLIGLKIISKSKLLPDQKFLLGMITENNELISIFVKSVETATYNEKINTSKI
jgi:four helix bundle protein